MAEEKKNGGIMGWAMRPAEQIRVYQIIVAFVMAIVAVVTLTVSATSWLDRRVDRAVSGELAPIFDNEEALSQATMDNSEAINNLSQLNARTTAIIESLELRIARLEEARDREGRE